MHEQGYLNQRYQDEISIADILKKIWWRRGLFIVIPLLFLILASIFVLLSAASTNRPTVYFIELEGVSNSAYPNGSRFSPQDLLMPEVLERACQQINIEINDKLRRAIQVEYGMPSTEGIQKKYQQRLASKKLSTAEIEQINASYLKELKHFSQRGLRITINHSAIGLQPEQGAVLANALPRAWSEVYTTKYRVLVDTRLDNVAIINTKNPLETTSEILSARNMLKRMNNGLNILSSDNRLKSIVSESGMNSADLKGELVFFNEVYFRPLLAGLFNNPDQAAASFLAETRLEMNEIDRKIEGLDHSINDIRSFRQNVTSGKIAEDSGETIQLGENTIGQIIDLGNKASLSDFLRQVLTKRAEFTSERAALEKELERSQLKLKMARDDTYLNRASEQFSMLNTQYLSLLKAARQISQHNYSNFFQALGSPRVVGSMLPNRSMLLMALSVFMGVFVSLLVALALPIRDK